MSAPTLLSSAPTPAATPRECRHCGAALLDARLRESGFCCAGCAYVYRLVHEHGLDAYYKIKDTITAPADAAVFQPRDYAWLEAAQRESEADTRGTPELALSAQGISCAGCVWLIERVFQQQPGARDVVVNAATGAVHLRWIRGEFSAVEWARKLQAFGYLLGPAGAAGDASESRALAKRIGLCAACAMNVMLYALPTYFGMEPSFEWAGLFGVLALVFATGSMLVGGGYFISRAIRALRERALHIDLPIALGIVGAYAGSLYGWFAGEEHFVYFDFVSAFILLMLIGRWAQVAAVERNRRRLLACQPAPARVKLADGSAVPPEQVMAGHEVRLAPGQTLPVKARLLRTEGTFSLASINGEAEPRLHRAGQTVPAGAVNVGRGELALETLEAWSDSLLARLLCAPVRESARSLLLERIVKGYLIGIIVVATLSGLGWWLAGAGALQAWAVVTAVLVVSCPCAVALAFPLADEIATVALRRRGVFVREGDLWTRLARVRSLVFDKTGTLTLETPVLQNPEALAALAPDALAALHGLVRDSAHPIAQALYAELLLQPTAGAPLAGEVTETIGAGVELGPWSLGRPGWRAIGAAPADTVLACDGEVVARFRFADTARTDARDELATLRARGFDVAILSGDAQPKVAALATALDLPADQALGDLTPQAKAAWLEAHGADRALMLGDGANDSLAFDRALCRGTPVIHRGVLEGKADFYYLGRGIGGIRALFEVDAIRRRTHGVILVFSIAYNALAVGLAVAGRMNPLVAAALMPINSLLTLLIVTGGMRRALRRGG